MSHHASIEQDLEETSSLIRYVNQRLIVKQLTQILKVSGMATSGLKGTLQKRLIDRIEYLRNSRDINGLRELKRVIYRPDVNTPTKSAVPSSSSKPASHHATASSMVSNGHSQGYTNGYHGPGHSGPASQPSTSYLNFTPSPFYQILESLTPATHLPVMAINRHVVTQTMQFDGEHADKINNRGYRCMIYCAVADTNNYNNIDIAFPQQIEIRVNNKQVPGNLRGLKNKPGTTRPLDITDQLTKWPGYKNGIQITYALSQKKFVFLVNLVRKHSAAELTEKIRHGKYISKATVLEEMRKQNSDADIVATSTVMSLKCPLSTLRIKIPARSSRCKHNQCFDTLSFLQLQEQAPTWNCPVCNKHVEFEELVVDKYVEDILGSVPKSVEQVTVDPEGDWSVPKKATPPPPNRSASYDENEEEEDDEDSDVGIVEVTHTKRAPRIETPSRWGFATPRSRETSSALSTHSRPGASSSTKRPASAVIDLTSTDDEDDSPPQPPSKRTQLTFPSVNSYNSTNSFNTYQYSSYNNY